MTENDIRYAIREAVAKAGTQGALARKTGVPQSTTSDYLNGRYAIGNMNLSTLFKLFPELSVDFFGDIESEPRSLMEKQLLKLFANLSAEEQLEAITMIAIQVMGNDRTIGIGASQGNFELNVFMPVLAYNMMQSIRLLSDGMVSFELHCVRGIKAKKEKMDENLRNSLMLVTCLSPVIGYENAAACAHKAFEENTTLKEAVLALGFLSESEYDEAVRPEKMV